MGLKRPGINHDFVLSESMFSFFRKNPKSHSQIPPDLPEPTTPTSPTSPTLFGSTRGVGSQKWETLDQIKLLILQNKDVLGNSEIEFMKRLLQLQQLAPASGKLAKRRKMKEKTFLDQVNTLCDDVKKALPNRSVDSLVGEKPRQQLPGSHNEVRSWAPHGQHTTGPSRVQDNVSLTSSYVNVSVEDTQSSSFTRQEGQKPINPPPGPDHHEGSKEPPKSHKDYSRAKSPLLIEEANQVLSRQDRTNKRREDDKRVEGSWHPGRRSGERLESNENRSKSVARDQSRPHHHRYYSEKIEYQRDRDRDWGRDRDKVKEKDRDRERDRYRERDREREKERYNYKRHGEIRNQYGSRERKERDGYEVGERARDVEREKDIDSGKDEKHVEGRNREKEPYDEKSRDRSKYDERGKDRERDRKYDKEWSDRKDRDRDRDRERERDRGRERDRDREEREKYRERDRERYDKERERYTDRDKDKDKDRQKDRDRRDGRDRMDNFTRPRHKSVPPERSARIDGNRNDTNQDTPPITNNLDLEPPSKDPIPRFVYPDDPLPPPQPRLQRKPTTGVPHIPTIVAYPDSDGEGEPGIRTRTSVVGERPRGVRRAQTQIRASGKAEAKQYARPMYKKFMSGPAPGSEPHEQVQGIPKNPLPPRVMVTPPSHPGLANQYQKHHKEQLPPSRFHEVFSPDVASAAVIHLPPSSEAS